MRKLAIGVVTAVASVALFATPATRDICLQREGAPRCSAYSWDEPTAVLQNASVFTYPIWEIDGSTYSISSVLEATAGATDLAWESDLNGVILGF